MKINNHQELLHKKNILKEAILIQEDQLKNSSFVNVFKRFKKINKKRLGNSHVKAKKVNSRIEQGVDLALTALSSQLLKGKNIGMFPKLAIGAGILFAGKIIAEKIDQYISKENVKSIE